MQEAKKINPLIAIAAVSVILFSLVGIGVMTGLIPNSSSSSRNNEATLVTTAPTVATSSASTKTEAPSASDNKIKTKADATAAPKHKTPVNQAGDPAAETTAQTVAQPATPVETAPPIQAKAAPVCTNCGVVTGVNAIKQQGEGSGLGAVAGSVVGGLLGHQIGGGTGKKIATVAGAAGGAFAGHQVEKNMKSSTHYEVNVKMEDGSVRTFPDDTQSSFQTGSKVRVVNGTLSEG
jgi:outer membrane lipoprotein SlyB